MEMLLLLRFAEKLLALLGGILCIYLGYRLFIKGISGQASLRVAHDRLNAQLLNAAPGIFFALFGMSVLGLSVWRQTDLFIAEPVRDADQNVSYKPLPETTAEVEAIRKLFKDPSSKLGRQVQPEEFNSVIEGLKQGKYRILHVATHGYFIE
jgi:CHAT domain-containing protein